MRVVFFTNDYTTHDRRFLEALSASRHEIWHLRLDRGPLAYETRPLPAGVRGIELPAAPAGASMVEGLLHRMAALEAALDDVRPDLLHAGPVQSAGFMAALSGHHPLMLASWSFDILLDAERSEAMRWITRYTLERADWMLVDSDAVREALPRYAAVPAERMVQMPWGLDLSRAVFGRARPIEEWPRPDGTIEIISTRTWGPMGDIPTVLGAFRIAYERDRRLRLVLVGDGPEAPAVKAAIARHGLKGVVSCPGRMLEDELAERVARADIYLACTVTDGGSVSLMEAMALGLPVVVSDLPGNREWICSDAQGFLAPVGDAARYAEGLVRAARLTVAERESMARANRARIEDRADWRRNVQRLIAAYDRIEAELPSRKLRARPSAERAG